MPINAAGIWPKILLVSKLIFCKGKSNVIVETGLFDHECPFGEKCIHRHSILFEVVETVPVISMNYNEL